MLTTRQCEVLRLLAEGKTNKEIASSLRIVFRTVHLHKAMIRRELSEGRLNIDELSSQLKGKVGKTDIEVVKNWLKRSERKPP